MVRIPGLIFPKECCRGIQLTDLLIEHGFKVEVREYVQQMLFPSEVTLAYK